MIYVTSHHRKLHRQCARALAEFLDRGRKVTVCPPGKHTARCQIRKRYAGHGIQNVRIDGPVLNVQHQ